ncbi:MAG: amidinotransferase [Prevotellaceae bacterium]|nr:amidinotransferase [Prevotellaceae bacterium]
MKQTTSTILMIEPVAFGFNEQTAGNNYFQQKNNAAAAVIQQTALAEFQEMVDALRAKKVAVIVEKDTGNPHTPDSIFPNNWVSFHADGKVALYPMYAENRRAERRLEILQHLEEMGFHTVQVVDFTHYEQENRFLEGTGSMILDRTNGVAYAALSPRTDKLLFDTFCDTFGFRPFAFSAKQTIGNQRLPIYHTNVTMCVADRYALVCLSAIDEADERTMLCESLAFAGKEIIEISEQQMHRFAGNMLQIESTDGEKLLAMSDTAYQSLTIQQIQKIYNYNDVIRFAVPTIERAGGGSVRCMMAEVFLPKIK